jgi:hypothetical protein
MKNKMNRRITVIVCGTALLTAVAVAVALHSRRQPLPPPDVSAALSSTEVRVRTVKRNTMPLEQGTVVATSDAVASVCGADEATADLYEARNDALRSVMRSRRLTKEDAAALLDYLASTNDAMRVERVAALKNDVMNLLRRQETPVEGLAETLPVLRKALSSPRRDAVLDIVAIGSIGLLGDSSDIPRLSHFMKCDSRRASAAGTAIRRINERSGTR